MTTVHAPRPQPATAPHRGTRVRPACGFTLVEVLVALLVMSLIAGMAWQGVDGMVRTRDASQRRLESTLRLGTVLAQWQHDLASLQESGGVVPALRCDGATLQLTRRAPAGMQLVVWSLRGGRLLRWAAPVAVTSAELQDRWLRAQQLLGEEPSQVRMLEGVSQWQLYFFRRNGWSNCQSSGDLLAVEDAPPPPAPAASAPPPAASAPPVAAGRAASTPAAGPRQREELPAGVRLVLAFAAESGQAGTLTRDTLLPPQWR